MAFHDGHEGVTLSFEDLKKLRTEKSSILIKNGKKIELEFLKIKKEFELSTHGIKKSALWYKCTQKVIKGGGRA